MFQYYVGTVIFTLCEQHFKHFTCEIALDLEVHKCLHTKQMYDDIGYIKTVQIHVYK